LPGPPGEDGEEGPISTDKPPKNAATQMLLIFTIVLNAMLAFGLYLFLKFLHGMSKKKGVAY